MPTTKGNSHQIIIKFGYSFNNQWFRHREKWCRFNYNRRTCNYCFKASHRKHLIALICSFPSNVRIVFRFISFQNNFIRTRNKNRKGLYFRSIIMEQNLFSIDLKEWTQAILHMNQNALTVYRVLGFDLLLCSIYPLKRKTISYAISKLVKPILLFSLSLYLLESPRW